MGYHQITSEERYILGVLRQQGFSDAEMARMLGRSDLKPVHQPERVGDIKHSFADITRATQLLAYQPIVPFTPGLEKTVAWYRQTMK